MFKLIVFLLVVISLSGFAAFNLNDSNNVLLDQEQALGLKEHTESTASITPSYSMLNDNITYSVEYTMFLIIVVPVIFYIMNRFLDRLKDNKKDNLK